ncbi:hypothetical protein BD626DRAFT_44875 [Schizophyllum amplum]|uniref:Uncharacterized protein n=1 Tax=Schizophyllum amplum TaxID=97359 RepID=A0A550CE06_9AGAR|nr:hypothetical protein BD626DRAFT_44875 [Auriculariopsis ampla]
MASDWGFNFRQGYFHDSDDSDAGDEGAPKTETELIQEFDLGSRDEAGVKYKPNPFSIAKINAAARGATAPNKPVKAAVQRKQSTTKKGGASTIEQAFKIQATRSKPRQAVTSTVPPLSRPSTTRTTGPRNDGQSRTPLSPFTNLQHASRPRKAVPARTNAPAASSSTAAILRATNQAHIPPQPALQNSPPSTQQAAPTAQGPVSPHASSLTSALAPTLRLPTHTGASHPTFKPRPRNVRSSPPRPTPLRNFAYPSASLAHPSASFSSPLRATARNFRTPAPQSSPIHARAAFSAHVRPVLPQHRHALPQITSAASRRRDDLMSPFRESASSPLDQHGSPSVLNNSPSPTRPSRQHIGASCALPKALTPSRVQLSQSGSRSCVQRSSNVAQHSPGITPPYNAPQKSQRPSSITTTTRESTPPTLSVPQKRCILSPQPTGSRPLNSSGSDIPNAYTTSFGDPDEEWRTLSATSAKRRKTSDILKRGGACKPGEKGVRTSGMFRMPGLLGRAAANENVRKSGVSPTSKRRVITFLPPPLVSKSEPKPEGEHAYGKEAGQASGPEGGRAPSSPVRNNGQASDAMDEVDEKPRFRFGVEGDDDRNMAMDELPTVIDDSGLSRPRRQSTPNRRPSSFSRRPSSPLTALSSSPTLVRANPKTPVRKYASSYQEQEASYVDNDKDDMPASYDDVPVPYADETHAAYADGIHVSYADGTHAAYDDDNLPTSYDNDVPIPFDMAEVRQRFPALKARLRS